MSDTEDYFEQLEQDEVNAPDLQKKHQKRNEYYQKNKRSVMLRIYDVVEKRL